MFLIDERARGTHQTPSIAPAPLRTRDSQCAAQLFGTRILKRDKAYHDRNHSVKTPRSHSTRVSHCRRRFNACGTRYKFLSIFLPPSLHHLHCINQHHTYMHPSHTPYPIDPKFKPPTKAQFRDGNGDPHFPPLTPWTSGWRRQCTLALHRE